MKEQLERRTCDQCGKSQEFNKNAIGSNYFSGWIILHIDKHAIIRPALEFDVNGMYTFHTCSLKCAQEKLNSLNASH